MVITKNQGISSILVSNISAETITKSSSSPMKRIASSEEEEFDTWSSLIQQKSQELTENKPLPPPYIHPSASSLSKNSLQFCTESLGSESGSDGFLSSYPSSESGEDDKETGPEHRFENFERVLIPAAAKKSPQRTSFPPPIPSRASVRMQSRRDDGRLVLEAVSVSCTNNFIAQRQDGRLVLTFTTLSEIFFDDEEEEDKETDESVEEAPNLSSRLINMHRDPTWPNKFNEVAKFDEVEEEIKPAIVAKSLPPMARLIPKSPPAAAVAAAAGEGGGGGGGGSSNACEYFWRPESMTTESKGNNNKNNNQEQQQILALRGNEGDHLVPLVKSCKEARICLLFWETSCIATSRSQITIHCCSCYHYSYLITSLF